MLNMGETVGLSRHRAGLVAFILGSSVGCGGLVRAEPDGGAGDIGSSSGESTGGNTGSGSGSGGSPSTSSSSSSGSSTGTSSGSVKGSGVDSGGTGVTLGCSGGDCTGMKVCCASVSFTAGLSVTSACANAPCASGDYQFCTSTSECTSGTCGANPVGMGPEICSGGTTGGGGLFGGH
jgi:hypothetical protein